MRSALAVIALLLASSAFALDPTPSIKATPVLKTTTSWNGAPLVLPQGPAEVSGLVIEIAPGAETGWHKHPIPSFAYLLEGELEVALKDGKTKRIKAGEALAEVVDTWHNGHTVGDKPVKLVVFYVGNVGSALTIKADADHQH
ncbi:Cupin domain protein [Andreprevotia lacus DSM 23236]|jgi:quercetin dioxygenase-like cupin family protein|uniref:Cupin domain protein n=1 Tax=Andreprevotia lacus DSM 23236 TaxID=1121001 RepID=A0A1W1Y0L1_9NEIS|nr:cupin domain-containing protein [Andreprevotia lacus]SMC29331.1 Cupin domain protein [Andreprevotia lacus DSM 23236]